MQPIYLRMTRNEAVALMLQIDPEGQRGMGICGERRGVVALEAQEAEVMGLIVDLAVANAPVISEAEFFAAPSVLYPWADELKENDDD